MKTISKCLLLIACLFIAGCEVYTSTHPHPHHGVYEVYEVGVVCEDGSYCLCEPYAYEVTPYYSSPWSCYDVYGVEYCEWVFADYGVECVETWYWDYDWCEWVFYDEACYYW